MTHTQQLRTWLPGLLLLFSITATSWSQEKSSSNYESLVHEVVTKIEEVVNSKGEAHNSKGEEIYKKNLAELLRLQYRIKQYLTLAQSEQQYAKELEDRGRLLLKMATEELEQLDAEATKVQGMRIQSAETIEFLIRNCLIEQQRLQLDAITARKMLEKKSKPDDKEFEAARLRLEAEELSLKGLREKLTATKKEIEALKSEDRKVIEKSLLEQEQEIAVRTTKLRAMMAEFEQAKANRANSYEDQVLDIRLRQELLTAQLDRLTKQQQWASKAKQLDTNLESATKRIREAEGLILKSAAQQSELKALYELIENVGHGRTKKQE